MHLNQIKRLTERLSFWQVYFISALFLILLLLLRFNKTGIFNLFEDTFNDSFFYEAMVVYFRTGAITENFVQPFTYRPVLPLIASVLPFGPLTSINLVNIFAMVGSLYFLQRIYLLYGFKESKWWVIGNFLFVFSFPTFYYGTIGIIEPLLIFTMFFAFYLALKQKIIWCILLFFIGMMIKETFIILLPIWLLLLYQQKVNVKKIILIGLAVLVVAALATIIARNWLPTNTKYFWVFDWNLTLYNMGRPRTWLSGLLSAGIPGFIVIYSALKLGKNFVIENHPLYIAFLLYVILYFYSILSAHSDGRFIWLSYPFIVPLALIALRRLYSEGKKS